MENGKQWFGHPRGLSTLFFTELWERMSYYGMRALLVLFMTATVVDGGLQFGTAKATAIYGLYTFGVYAMALPGGWMADKLFGQKKAVLYGGILIALGHYTLAIPAQMTFFIGLVLIVLGTGLLKPNVSSVVGELYPEGGARKDAGFSIFYMGINLGAILGPMICSYLGEKVDWHWGFGAAGIGMTLGLIQYVIGQKHMKDIGNMKGDAAEPAAIKKSWLYFGCGIGITVLITAAIIILSKTNVISFTLVQFAKTTGYILLALTILYFAWNIIFKCENTNERKSIGVIAILFLGATMFWAGFEQAGSSMNIFARDNTDLLILGWNVPVGYFQQINPQASTKNPTARSINP